jgi:hypothetical protein
MADHEQELRADYLAWSGGLKPQSEEQVDAYVLASLPVAFDAESATDSRTRWMHEPVLDVDDIRPSNRRF